MHETTASFARRAALLGAAGAATLAALPAQANGVPPQQGPMPPRFHRLKLGDVEVTTLLDGAMQGTNAGIQNFFPDSTPAEIAPLRERAFAMSPACTSRSAPICSTPAATSPSLIAAGTRASSRPPARRSPRSAPRATRPSRWTRCC